MKQGRAPTVMGSTKHEPISRAVSPGAVSEIGTSVGRQTHTSIYAGRGFKAPMAGATNHPSGSQGKHK